MIRIYFQGCFIAQFRDPDLADAFIQRHEAPHMFIKVGV